MAKIGIEWVGNVSPGLVLGDMSETIDAKATKFLLAAAEIVRAAIVQQIAGWVGKTDRRPTGQLMGSWRVDVVTGDKGVLTTGVFSDLVYARIHDVGGTIKPRKKFLTVPLIDMPIGTTAGSMSDLVFAQSKRGSKFLVRPAMRARSVSQPRKSTGLGARKPRPVIGGDNPDTLIWFLAPEVQIKAKRYLEGAAEVAGPLIEEMAAEFWGEALT